MYSRKGQHETHTTSAANRFFPLFVAVAIFSAVAPPPPANAQICTGTAPPCVLTQANDNARDGLNPYETSLTPANLPSQTTHQLFLEVDDTSASLPIPGAPSNPIMAQPLYVYGITVVSPANTGNCGAACNMVIAGTLNGTVFAWNADTGNALWSRQGVSGSNTYGGNALWWDDCGQNSSTGPVQGYSTIAFNGILSTPVIDPGTTSGATPVMFLTSWCSTNINCPLSGSAPMREWWLHEIDLTTGLDVLVGGSPQRRRIQNDFGTSRHFEEYYENQRSALLEVRNPGASPYDHLIYIPFGTGVSENNADQNYRGWLIAYTTSSSYALAPVFGYTNEPTGCGSGGGLLSGGGSNSPTQCTGNAGSPPCDCYFDSSFPTGNTPNWGGHGGGCWMSGNGPAATAPNIIKNSGGSTDGDVHVFFGCGNGGFQDSGLGGMAGDNFGSTVMDFRLEQSYFDSALTGPFQTFTPNSPAAGVGPALPGNVCNCPGTGTAGCGPCSYTMQTMNAWDYDQSTGGVVLFNDFSATPRLVTVDKAGYGYLLTQGNLCASGTTDTQCIGFAAGDPGSWTFGAARTLCTGDDDGCDRVTSMAFFNNQDSANPSAYLYFWPFDASSTGAERMTALALSDNSTPQTGTGSLTWSSGSSSTLSLSGSCTADVNCLTDQLVPGDALTLTGTGCGGSATVTTASDLGSAHQLTINGTVTGNFGSTCTAPSGFTYTGYFVTPTHDQTPAPTVTGYPGGALSLTAHYNSTVGYYTGGLIWAIVPNQVSVPETTNRGIGTLYASLRCPTAATNWRPTGRTTAATCGVLRRSPGRPS